MKLLLVNKYYHPVHGGIEQHVRDLARGLLELSSRHHGSLPGLEGQGPLELKVLVANTALAGEEVQVEGVDVTRVGSLGKLSSAPLAPLLPGKIARADASLVHFHFPAPPAEMAAGMLPKDRPMVVTYHSDIVRQRALGSLYRPVVERYLERADRIIVTSPRLLEYSETLAPHAAKCRVVPLGIDVAPFADGAVSQEKVTTLRNELGGGPIVLFVGRFIYYKGLEFLVRGFAEMIREHQGEFEPALVLVGAGPLEEEVRRLVRVLDIQDRVFFPGAVSNEELPLYFKTCDVFVLPSIERSEAFGIVQLEAMASGRPVISTDLPSGVPWVNQDLVTGRVVPPRDSHALAAAISRITSDPNLIRRYGDAAHERVVSEFTREKMVEGVVAVYRELLA